VTVRTLLRSPTAFVPLLLSAVALALVLVWVALFGVARNADEGAPARLFQLLMGLQLLIIAAFAVEWLPRAPRPALLVLALQLGAALLPLATIIVLES